MQNGSFVQLQEAEAQAVTPLQLPSKHTRVSYLIDNFNNSDADLAAAIASIRVDTNGMRSNFEAVVAFLLPVDPYVKHKKTDRQVTIANTQVLKNKSVSNTGVDLRCLKIVQVDDHVKNAILYDAGFYSGNNEGYSYDNLTNVDKNETESLSTAQLYVSINIAQIHNSTKNIFCLNDL